MKIQGPPRDIQSQPIVPKVKGLPPGWVVKCRDCDFTHDSHGKDANEAVAAIKPTHDRSHFLYAKMVSYLAHSRDPDTGELGVHPLYRR